VYQAPTAPAQPRQVVPAYPSHAAPAPTHPRPHVLAHPSPTTGRFLLLIGALVSVGLLVGTLVHNGLIGQRWAQSARECIAEADAAVPIVTDVSQEIERSRVQMACLAPAERTRALFSVGSAALIAVLSLGVVLTIPSFLRRRYRLRPAGPRLEKTVTRIAELAGHIGLKRPPRLMVGRAGQRDAFVFGRPGRYELVLPTALVVRPRDPFFDPVVRHELAHQQRHDVPLAWLATAAWIAAIPILIAPLIVAVVQGDLSIMPAFLWRAAVVMAVVWLVRRQALRSREHDADLHAAHYLGDWRPLATVLSTSNQKPSFGRRVLSHHPTTAQRLEVLADPARVRAVSFVDALIAAFLTSILLPLILTVLQVYFTATPFFSWTPHLSAAIVGPVTGFAVGVGLWRQAMIDQVTGTKSWPFGALLGMLAGLLLGQVLRFDDLAIGDRWTTAIPVTILIAAATVLLSAGTGRLWADAAARLPGGRRSWWIAVVVNALIFSTALWAIQWVPVVIDAAAAGGLSASDLVISFGALVGPVSYVVLVPLVVSMAAMIWRRRPLPMPAWLVEGPAPPWSWSARKPGVTATVLAGVLPGLLAALAVLLHRLRMGSPVDDDDRLSRYLLWLVTGTTVALLVSFIMLVAVPRSGAAVGLVSGAFAAATAALGIVASNTFIIGNIFELSFWWMVIVAMVTLWLAGYLLILPTTLVVWAAPWRDVPGWVLVPLTVAGGGLLATVVTLA
jgi:Zn-dependent protease with chaperone function